MLHNLELNWWQWCLMNQKYGYLLTIHIRDEKYSPIKFQVYYDGEPEAKLILKEQLPEKIYSLSLLMMVAFSHEFKFDSTVFVARHGTSVSCKFFWENTWLKIQSVFLYQIWPQKQAQQNATIDNTLLKQAIVRCRITQEQYERPRLIFIIKQGFKESFIYNLELNRLSNTIFEFFFNARIVGLPLKGVTHLQFSFHNNTIDDFWLGSLKIPLHINTQVHTQKFYQFTSVK